MDDLSEDLCPRTLDAQQLALLTEAVHRRERAIKEVEAAERELSKMIAGHYPDDGRRRRGTIGETIKRLRSEGLASKSAMAKIVYGEDNSVNRKRVRSHIAHLDRATRIEKRKEADND